MGQYALIKAISAPNYTNCKTSALGQQRKSVMAKPDIFYGMSEAEAIPDVPRTWLERLY